MEEIKNNETFKKEEQMSDVAGKKYWLHRISYLSNVSYPLLERNYLSIGFSDFSNNDFLEKAIKGDWNYFDEQFEKLWKRKPKNRHTLWRFLTGMKSGDIVLVPNWREFSLYEIEEFAPIIPAEFQIEDGFCDWNGRKISKNENGMFLIEGENNPLDIGFIRKVKPIELKIPRYDYADSALTSRMKIRPTNADISDLRPSIEKSLSNWKERKPINLKSSLMEQSESVWLEIIKKDLDPVKFQKLVERYLVKVGATQTDIDPERNKSCDNKSGDVDVIGVFEPIKVIINIQVKFYEGETSDWAVEQIKDYAESKSDISDGYSRIYWVISSSNNFSQKAENLATEKGIFLFNGRQFVRMLMEAGIGSIDELK